MTLVRSFLAVLTAPLTWFARRRPDEPLGSCRCPHCHQKLRYRAGQAGRKMLCPRCVRAFTVPVAGEASEGRLMPK